MKSYRKMEKKEENKFEKDIRFIARHYDSTKLDVDKAWSTLSAQKGIRKNFSFRPFFISAAAVFLLMIGLRWYVWNKNQPEWVLITAGETNLKHITLPDQTFIVLAHGGEIRYDAKQFTKKNRTIFLTGKASMNVYRDENKPFIVLTPLSEVKVLGTEFQIHDRGESVNISVFTGKVSFAVEKGEKEVILTKGMTATYSTTQEDIEIDEEENPNLLSWQSGNLLFQNTPLLQVVKDLEEHYEITITNIPEHTDLRLTASFSDLPLSEVLWIINQTLDIQLTPKQN